jgi:ADP-dependent NAD(P)H-hydrate dehydratase / NAD(P)H-hydrate epimerase
MVKILAGSEVADLDRFHLEEVGCTSHDFMEQVAQRFVGWFVPHYPSKKDLISIFCGAGNNGGDGLAIARLLFEDGYTVQVVRCFDTEANLSADCRQNLALLPSRLPIIAVADFDRKKSTILLDAYLGVGLKGSLRSEALAVLDCINSFSGKVISIDLPSGLPADSSYSGACVCASVTVTFGFPKLSLLFPEHATIVGELVVLDIGLGDQEYAPFSSRTFYLQEKDVLELHKIFHRFAHKGDFGKVLLVAGNKGKMGAAVLAAKSALRTGSGLVSCLVPEEERGVLQCAVPEAMCVFGEDLDFSSYDALGLGPGMGTNRGLFLEKILAATTGPIVLDADALTCLAANKSLWSLLPEGSILTPHLKEFERLLGPCANHPERIAKAQAFCLEFGVNLLLKGANSCCVLSDGRLVFNSTGSKHMASGGMGDVLTGMLTSFLGQGYSPENALLCGVFHHGLAGELAGENYLRGTMAQDVIEAIPATFRHIGLD